MNIPPTLRARIKANEAKIKVLERSVERDMQLLAKFFAKFKVGDHVEMRGTRYVITSYSIWDANSTDVLYRGQRVKKDGTPFNERPRRLWSALKKVPPQ